MEPARDIRNPHLKVLFLVHFILIIWSTFGYWSSHSYSIYNCLYLLTLLWGIHAHESSEALQMAILINVVSIPLDIIEIAVFYPSSNAISQRFSAAIAIIHLIVRPFTTLFLVKIYGERNGSLAEVLGNVGSMLGGRNRMYEDMDRNAAPSGSAPQQQGGYDFSAAAQI